MDAFVILAINVLHWVGVDGDRSLNFAITVIIIIVISSNSITSISGNS